MGVESKMPVLCKVGLKWKRLACKLILSPG